MASVKWSRAVTHLSELADRCGQAAASPVRVLPVTSLWVFGGLLGPVRDLEVVEVALAVDLPPQLVPWLGRPVGAQHWAAMTRMDKNPVVGRWRSDRVPVWNHSVVRPLLVWDAAGGRRDPVVEAVSAGRAEPLRPSAPSPAELAERLRAELAVSLGALRRSTREYDDRRWRPGTLTAVSDALHDASAGYLDVLDALERLTTQR
jgi:hypothetical protein